MAARETSSFARKKPSLRPQPKVLIICEDSKSSKDYLEDVCKSKRVHALVEISHCGKTDPAGIVNSAISRQDKFDHIFCVIDRDGHPSFEAALLAANSHTKIGIIASFPCFEFWLLLHFGYCRKPYNPAGTKSSADRLIDDLRSKPLMAPYTKGASINLFETLSGTPFDTAMKVSPKVLATAISENEMNPSTQFHTLIAFIESLSKPSPVYS